MEVEALLVKFADVFARSTDDLGRTSIVGHETNTSGTRPIRQHPRRLPLSQRVEAEAEIANMLQRRVIEPSSDLGIPHCLGPQEGWNNTFLCRLTTPQCCDCEGLVSSSTYR